jgi:catechol 2,3-dioxygenase-like lactoylglutathione lyase family enzyme
MTEALIVQHVALEYSSKEKADLFFAGIFGMEKVKTALLPRALSFAIFGIDSDVEMVTYRNETACFEVFLHERRREYSFTHLGVHVHDKDAFVTRCKDHGLKPFLIQKNDKQLLFVRDFSGNLFEILE